MLLSYAYVGLFLVATILFTLVMVLLPALFRRMGIAPQKPDPVKTSTYECGLQTIGKTWVQFNFRYYFYALLFLVFDVIIVFLYPWAVALRDLGYTGLVGIIILIFITLVGYVYAWKKKVLEWK